MTVICVTGASGRLGRAVVAELLGNGYQVRAVDLVASGAVGAAVMVADLTDFGQAVEALSGASAVVHAANIPAPDRHTPAVTFRDNITMNYAVFTAAAQLGLERVVWASSETTLGLPFEEPPKYAPVDEDHYPYPTTAYALSKVASETIAGHVARWSGIPFLALRFSNIIGPAEYARIAADVELARARRWNLWGYIDERDAALACRLALGASVKGSSAYIIAAADTISPEPSATLMAASFPGTRVAEGLGEFDTLLSIERARRVLSFVPQHSWRD